MSEDELSKIIVDCCFRIHIALGPGLFESVYEEILAYELEQSGLEVSRQKSIPVVWEDLVLDKGFRADLIVEDKVLIELKSVSQLAPVHRKQVHTYLKLTELKLGLLVNFNEYLIKNGIKRIVNGL